MFFFFKTFSGNKCIIACARREGLYAEDHVANSNIGLLFYESLREQYERVRDGDRLYFENDRPTGPGFTAEEISALRSTKLRDVVLRNTNINPDTFPQSLFFFDKNPTPAPAGTTPPPPADIGVDDGLSGEQTVLNGNYKLWWRASPASDGENRTMSFSMRAKGTGWVGLGLAASPTGKMSNADVFIGYVKADGTAHVGDYWSKGAGTPELDATLGGADDLMQKSAIQAGGYTTVNFTRYMTPRGVGGANPTSVFDREISATGSVDLILAYHETSDDSLEYHGRSNRVQIAVELIRPVSVAGGVGRPPPSVSAPAVNASAENVSAGNVSAGAFDDMKEYEAGSVTLKWKTSGEDKILMGIEFPEGGWGGIAIDPTDGGMLNADMYMVRGWRRRIFIHFFHDLHLLVADASVHYHTVFSIVSLRNSNVKVYFGGRSQRPYSAAYVDSSGKGILQDCWSSGYVQPKVQAESGVTLIKSESDSTTKRSTVYFERPLAAFRADEDKPILDAKQKLSFAWGDTGEPGYHGENKLKIEVNLLAEVVSVKVKKDNTKRMMEAHGAIMGTMWAGLAVLGVAIARFGRSWRYWMRAHRAIQTTVTAMALIGEVMGFAFTKGNLQKAHGYLAIIVIAVTFPQVTLGTLALKHQQSAHYRRLHRGTGYFLLTIAMYQVYTGMRVLGASEIALTIYLGWIISLVVAFSLSGDQVSRSDVTEVLNSKLGASGLTSKLDGAGAVSGSLAGDAAAATALEKAKRNREGAGNDEAWDDDADDDDGSLDREMSDDDMWDDMDTLKKDRSGNKSGATYNGHTPHMYLPKPSPLVGKDGVAVTANAQHAPRSERMDWAAQAVAGKMNRTHSLGFDPSEVDIDFGDYADVPQGGQQQRRANPMAPKPKKSSSKTSLGRQSSGSGLSSIGDAITKAEFNAAIGVGCQWLIVDGYVIDVGRYLPRHPGGPELIQPHIGTDGTTAFMEIHGSTTKAKRQLMKLCIGPLAEEDEKAETYEQVQPPRTHQATPRNFTPGVGVTPERDWSSLAPAPTPPAGEDLQSLREKAAISSGGAAGAAKLQYLQQEQQQQHRFQQPQSQSMATSSGAPEQMSDDEFSDPTLAWSMPSESGLHLETAAAAARAAAASVPELVRRSASFVSIDSSSSTPSKWVKVELISREPVSHDSALFHFAVPGAPITTRPGGHVLLRASVKSAGGARSSVVRPYSPLPPLKRLPPGTLSFVIKRYPDGQLTPSIFRLRNGDTVEAKGPLRGPFEYNAADHRFGPGSAIGILCGGTGISPMISLVHQILSSPEGPPIRLLYCNTSEDDILMRAELEGMEEAARGSGRFSVFFTLSKPPGPNWTHGIGRVNADMIREHLPPPTTSAHAVARTHILVCGPPGFMTAVAGAKVHRDTEAPLEDDDDDGENDFEVEYVGGLVEQVGHARGDIHRYGDR